MTRLGFWIGCAIIALAAPAVGRDASQLCDDAAAIASRESGVPIEILRAITRTETGRSKNGALRPWPWTVNMEGEGRWFDDRAAALAYVDSRRRAGAKSFDIGCFQINHRWHGDAFASIDEMFDPVVNARYAARFLNEIRSERPARAADWRRIAGAYHSRTPHFAEIYRKRFAEILRRLEDGPASDDGEPIIALGPGPRLLGPRMASLSAPVAERRQAAGRLGGVGLGAFRAAKPFFPPHPGAGG